MNDEPGRGCNQPHRTAEWHQTERLKEKRMAKENQHTEGDAQVTEGKLTTAAGAPVPDNQNVQTAGPRGPQLLQDVWFLEKLAHFDREVIPERRMPAKESGAV